MPITPAQPMDIPNLVQLVNSAYRGENGQKGWTNESHLVDGSRTNADSLAGLMQEPHSVILKYVDDEGVTGGCIYLQQQDDKLYFGMLSVWPLLQGSGIGKQLMAAAMDHARQHGCSVVGITVISVRHELIDWYERHGFQRTGETEPFHGGTEFGIQKQPFDLVLLEKRL